MHPRLVSLSLSLSTRQQHKQSGSVSGDVRRREDSSSSLRRDVTRWLPLDASWHREQINQ